MASLFAEAWSDASADLDAEFGEAFLLMPTASPFGAGSVRDPNARPVASADRGPTAFVGIFFDKGAVLNATGRGMADSTTRPVVAERPMIDVDRTQFDRAPMQGDHIARVEPAQIFEVTSLVVDDLNRAWIHLAERRPSVQAFR